MTNMNTNLFQTLRGKMIPAAPARNEAGGVAYTLSPKAALAQYAATGCMNRTFYATADEQMKAVLALAMTVEGSLTACCACPERCTWR